SMSWPQAKRRKSSRLEGRLPLCGVWWRWGWRPEWSCVWCAAPRWAIRWRLPWPGSICRFGRPRPTSFASSSPVIAAVDKSQASTQTQQTPLRLVMVGNPNTGKSTLINSMSGADLRVGNWPGTTVDRLELRFALDGRPVQLVDLPGTYTLAGATSEETVTRTE